MSSKRSKEASALRRKAIQYCRDNNLTPGRSSKGWRNKRLFMLVAAHATGDAEKIAAVLANDCSSVHDVIAKGKAIIEKVTPRKSGRVKRLEWRAASVAFYESDAWKRLRYQALKIHGAACQCCGATRADGVKIHVDHIKPRSKYPELELTLSNLQILCEPCNMGKSAIDETDWRNAAVP